jgi:hypothetical protein
MARSPRGPRRGPESGNFEQPDPQPGGEFGGEGADGGDGEGGASEQGGFEAPEPGALGAAAVDAEAAEIESAFGADLAALKGEIENSLAGRSRAFTEGASVQDLDASNIVGVGFGQLGDDTESLQLAGLPPGEPGLVVFTLERTDTAQVVSEISSLAGTRSLSSVPILQVPTGVVDAYSHRMRMRPAPGGISIGHHAITAGTLGCLATGLRAPRQTRLLVLSNNHVLANSNAGKLGDCIAQQGPHDGGKCPADQIAILERFVPINFSGGINYVDCATAWAWPGSVRRELMYLSGSTPVYFRVGGTPMAPTVGMMVGKTGRTTQLKQGRITAVNVSVNVNFGGGRVGHFRDQIAIVGTTSAGFSTGGDSGSLIWRWSAAREPVGLLFAGGGGTTFGNRITRVLTALDIRLYT